MRWLKISLVVALVAVSSTVIAFLNRDLLLKKFLIGPLQKEMLLPESFWRETAIKFFWQAPYEDFKSGKKVVRDGTILSDPKSGKDIIGLNLYILLDSDYNFQERVSIMKEALAHEAGHVLYKMAKDDKAYELKRQFRKELGEKFDEQDKEYSNFFYKYTGIMRYFSNSWEYRPEEASADIARMVICPSCKQKPDTAVIVTSQLKDLAKQIIDIALRQK